MSNPMFDLTGKVAVITGSTRGIGRAIAEVMGRSGARVVISSRKVEACETVAAELKEQGLDATAIPCNVSSREECEKLVTETRSRLGPVDILVGNAATNPVYGSLSKLSDEAFDKIMRTNVRSNLWLATMVAPEMAERGGGSVIFISSVAALRGTPVIGAYAMSKAADLQLARNLAVEWGRKNVRFNCVCPGLIKTDFAQALWDNPEIAERVNQATPLARIGDPEDIGGVAAFLATDAARYITGQMIVADGGMTITGTL